MKRQTIAFVACNHERIYAFAGGSSDHTASFAGHSIEKAVLLENSSVVVGKTLLKSFRRLEQVKRDELLGFQLML